jgi:SHS2 domain-containing protein
MAPYRFLEDAPTADVGFVASGTTLAECFQAAADATLAVMMGNPESLQPRLRRAVHVEADSLDLGLLKFLEEFIYAKDADGIFLRAVNVAVREQNDRWVVEATGEGEAINASRHRLSGDVKAVTLHRLDVRRTDSGWDATVVLDI